MPEIEVGLDSRIMKYFFAKGIPEFIPCFYGQEFGRVVGNNLPKVLQNIEELYLRASETLDKEHQEYRPFDATFYDRYKDGYEQLINTLR